MAAISTYLSDKLLDHATGDVAYTKPTCYLALFTTAPTMPAGTGGVEPSGGAYARIPLASLWAAAAAESKTTSGAAVFVTATADWGLIVACGIWDALTVGNLLFAAALTESKNVYNGDTFQFNTGQLTATLS